MKKQSDAYIEFDDNSVLQKIVGPENKYLIHLEEKLNVRIVSKGNQVAIFGHKDVAKSAVDILNVLYVQAQKNRDITIAEIDALVRLEGTHPKNGENRIKIETKKITLYPRSTLQGTYVNALQSKSLVFGIGPAGTGKTYLAVAVGVSMLMQGKVDRLVLSRPAVEAGEKLGFLPGNLQEKVDPYLKPIYDALHDMISPEEIEKYLENGTIEIAPLAFMRGRTLSHAYIILDEAQNTTPMQMKMFLTRLGENAHMVVTGDISQIDLLHNQESGLIDAVKKLKNIPEIGLIELTDADIVRHPLVAKIVKAYSSDSSV